MTVVSVVVSLTALLLPVQGEEATPAHGDPRSTILVREECVSSLGRREVTLFANGTVRLREGSPDSETMLLGEATADEVEAFVHRLAAPDLGETDPVERSPVGSWVESCSLDLALPEQEPARFRFGRYSSHSLALQTVLGVVRDIEAIAQKPSSASQLPPGYEPEPGDLLERADGVRFAVVGKTADGLGVELSSPDEPLTIYVALGDLRALFVRLLAPEERFRGN